MWCLWIVAVGGLWSFPDRDPRDLFWMATEAAEVGVEVKTLVDDLRDTCAAEVDLSGDLAEGIAERE